MPGQHTVLSQLVQRVPWARFAQLAAEPAYAHATRGFTAKSHLVALLYAQLIGAASLREIELGMASQAAQLAALAVQPARHTTLADANRDRPSALFIALLLAMLDTLNRAQRRRLEATVYLIDASFLALPARYAKWARFSAETCGAKMHVIYDAGEGRPTMPRSAPPRSTTSRPRRRCRWWPGPPMCSISATMIMLGGPRIMLGGPSSMPRSAALSPG